MKHLLTAFLALYAIFSVQAQNDVIAESHETLDCDSVIVVTDTTDSDPFPNVLEYMIAKDYNRILTEAQNYLDNDSTSVYARFLRGYANCALGNLEEAVEDMAFAWVTGFEYPHLNSPEKIMRFLATYVPENVISVLTPVEVGLIDLKEYPWVLYNTEMLLALANESLGKRGVAARIHYPRAMAAIPMEHDKEAFLMALYHQAKDWIYSGHPDTALNVLNRPEWNEDPDPVHFTLRSLALRNLGRIDEAICLMDSVISVYPADDRLYNHYGTLLSAIGRQDSAITCFTKAINLMEADSANYFNSRDYNNALLRRGYARRLKGDKKGARADYLAVIKRQPDNLIALSRLGRRSKIMKLLSDKIASHDYYYLAGAFANLGDDREAMYYLGRAFELQQTTPQSVLYDPNLIRLTKIPGYKKNAARFNPDN